MVSSIGVVALVLLAGGEKMVGWCVGWIRGLEAVLNGVIGISGWRLLGGRLLCLIMLINSINFPGARAPDEAWDRIGGKRGE